MAKTLKDLCLALLNATLILVALCLFLGWKLASTVDEVTSGLSEKLQVVAPLRDDAQAVRSELSALRSELANLRTEGASIDAASAQRISAVLDQLGTVESRLQEAQARIADLAASPDLLVDRAIERSVGTFADRIVAIRGCVPET